ncbi:MAG: outer membrane beta-barrel protein [Xanthobacteraceae bacterium]|jgi:outer membrane immunogenic protein
MKFNSIGGLAVSAMLVAAPLSVATAADMALKAPPPPPAPVFSWTGCYLGVNGGGGWKRTHDDITNNDDGFFGPAFAAGSTPSRYDLNNMNGGEVGGTIGCNYQPGGSAFVFGVEADYDWANISGSDTINTTTAGFVPGFGTATEKLTSIGTFRGRVGPTFGQLFLYATGGLAWGEVKYNYSWAYPGTGELYSASPSSTRVGWTAGVGGEYAFTNAWSAKVEALAFQLDGTTFFAPGLTTSTPPGDGHIVTAERDNGWMLRVGLNYKLNAFAH